MKEIMVVYTYGYLLKTKKNDYFYTNKFKFCDENVYISVE